MMSARVVLARFSGFRGEKKTQLQSMTIRATNTEKLRFCYTCAKTNSCKQAINSA
jgi:hypothetical protein